MWRCGSEGHGLVGMVVMGTSRMVFPSSMDEFRHIFSQEMSIFISPSTFLLSL